MFQRGRATGTGLRTFMATAVVIAMVLQSVISVSAETTDLNDGDGQGEVLVKDTDEQTPPSDSLRIIMEAPDDPDQVFSFTGPYGEFTLKHGEDYVAENLAAGESYEFRENLPARWHLIMLGCTGTGGADPIFDGDIMVGAKIWVIKDRQGVCTFTNVRLPGVWITKQTVNAPAGDDTAFPFSWQDGSTNVRAGELYYVGKLPSNGSLTITEDSLPSNWSLHGISCSGHAGGVTFMGASVTIQNKDGAGGYDNSSRQITCEFTNKYTGPAITVSKRIDGAYDAATVPTEGFDFNIAGTSVKVQPDHISAPIPVHPGTDISVREHVPAGWALKDAQCYADGKEWSVAGDGDSVRFTMPEFDVHCAFTNEHSRSGTSGGRTPPPPPTTVITEDEDRPHEEDDTPIVPEQPSAGPEPGDESAEESPPSPPASGPDLPFTGGTYVWYVLAGAALAAGGVTGLRVRRRHHTG